MGERKVYWKRTREREEEKRRRFGRADRDP